MTDIEKVALPAAAIENLTHHQQQADMDGTFVKVSRQALDEVLSFIAAMQPVQQEPVGSAAEITRLTEALRAAEEEKKGLREALVKADEPHWFYAEGYEDRCLYSPDDAIDLLDFDAGEYVTEVATARPCRSIWCAVRVTDDEDADERFTFTEHDSEEAARAALKGPSHDA